MRRAFAVALLLMVSLTLAAGPGAVPPGGACNPSGTCKVATLQASKKITAPYAEIGGVDAGTLLLTGASGAKAVQMTTGALLDLGGGSGDTLSSDGSQVIVGSTGLKSPTLDLSQATNQNALRLLITGARLKLSSAGTNDYFVSDGTNISTPSNFTAQNLITSNTSYAGTFRSAFSSSTLTFTADATDAVVTSAIPAFLLKPSVAYSANDLVLDVQNSTSTSLFKVDVEGDTTIASSLTISGSGGVQTVGGPVNAQTVTAGAYYALSATAIGTCDSANEGRTRRDNTAGGTSTSARTRACLCTSDGAASPTYAWVNVHSGAVGTTTTCPANTPSGTIGGYTQRSAPAVAEVLVGTRMATSGGKFSRLGSTVDVAGTGAGTYSLEVYDTTTATQLCASGTMSCTAVAGSIGNANCTGTFAQFDDVAIRVLTNGCTTFPKLNATAVFGP